MFSPTDISTINEGFRKVQVRLFRQFHKNPDLHAVLFLIGIRELGQVKTAFTKEEKQHLMHIAVCKLLSHDGYYELYGLDADGWPHWHATRSLPSLSPDQEELLLKKNIIRYFAQL